MSVLKSLVDYQAAAILSCLVPILYVWSMPILSSHDFATDGCGRVNGVPCALGHTLSNYIETPQATGAMAGAFSPAVALLWAVFYRSSSRLGRLLLMTSTTGFFLFLSTPVTKYKHLHVLSVWVMTVGFATFYLHTFLTAGIAPPKLAWLMLAVSITSMVLTLTVVFLQKLTVEYAHAEEAHGCGLLNLCKHRGAIWFLECAGLTSFVLILPVLAASVSPKT